MLKGTVALVTGGASGLGKATVERFVQRGTKVVICDLPTSKGAEVSKAFGDEKTLFTPLDVTSEKGVMEVLELTESRFGKLNYVVNCAGISCVQSTYNCVQGLPHSLDMFIKVLNVNTIGTFNVIRLAVGLIGKNEPNINGERGVIVNTASVAAFDGPSGTVAYSASKGAIVGMTLPLARDLASQGIRVVTIAPGPFKTPMFLELPKQKRDFLAKPLVFPSEVQDPTHFSQLVESIITNPMLNGETIRLDGAGRF